MGVSTAVGRSAGRIIAAVIGRRTTLPPRLTDRYPELARVRWRRGGLPVRVGGWCLGRSTVSAITLWRTIWMAPGVSPTAALLLHELRHVEQFEETRLFPILYLWESLTRGYLRNRFEVEARAYADTRMRESPELNA